MADTSFAWGIFCLWLAGTLLHIGFLVTYRWDSYDKRAKRSPLIDPTDPWVKVGSMVFVAMLWFVVIPYFLLTKDPDG